MSLDKKLTELPQVSSAGATDLFYIVVGGVPRAISFANLQIGIRQANYDVLQAQAAAAPLVPFVGVATMPDGSKMGVFHLGGGLFLNLGTVITGMTQPPEVG